MNIKLKINDIRDVHDKLFSGRMSVTDVSKEYGYTHPSAFMKRLKSLGYNVTRCLIKE